MANKTTAQASEFHAVIANTHSHAGAAVAVAKLQAVLDAAFQTQYDYRAGACPAGGSFDIVVFSTVRPEFIKAYVMRAMIEATIGL